MLELKVKKVHPDAIMPYVGTDGAACFDISTIEDIDFAPGEIKLVRTGLCIEPPIGWRLNLYPRSSTGLKRKFLLANSVGIIDEDFRHEIQILLMNIATEDGKFVYNNIRKGERIANLEVVPSNKASTISILEVDKLNSTNRIGGFGSTL